MTPQNRMEEYLDAIRAACLGTTPLPPCPNEPAWRIEKFLSAVLSQARNDCPAEPCPLPVWRIEMYLRAIYDAMGGVSPAWPCPDHPGSRIEEYLQAAYDRVANGNETPLPTPMWTIEAFIAAAVEASESYAPPVLKTLSGTSVHITDALEWPVEHLIAEIRFTQSGSGDPSFENVRPFTGYTGLTAWVFPTDNPIYYPPDSEEPLIVMTNMFRGMNGAEYRCSFICARNIPERYSVQKCGIRWCNAALLDVDLTDEEAVLNALTLDNPNPNINTATSSLKTNHGTQTQNINTTDRSLVFYTRGFATLKDTQTNEVFTVYSPNFLYGSYDTIKATRAQVDWNSIAGTVYVGTLDLITGVLRVLWAKITLVGGNEATYNTNGATETVSKCMVYAPGKALGINNMASDRFAFGYPDMPGFIMGRAGHGGIEFGLPASLGYDTAVQKQWFAEHNTELVYELETPVEYQLTPWEIRTMAGENYVWADTGDVTITFYTDGRASEVEALNILLAGNYSNPGTPDDVSDREALSILLGGDDR